DVVDESKKQVLPDVAHHGPAQVDCLDDAVEIAFYEGDTGALHRHIGSGSHGNADVGSREGRRIVDAVARHGDNGTFLSQAFDLLVFVLGTDARDDVINPEFFGNDVSRSLVIASHHNQVEAEPAQFRNRSG